MHIPLMYNYSGWSAYDDEKQVSLTTAFTIGNLGQSQPRCSTIKMVGGVLPVGCRTGLITQFTHVGVMAFHSEAENLGLCASGTSDNTGLDCDEVSRQDSALFEALKSECVGKDSCSISVHDYVYVGSQGAASSCTLDEKDSLFVQYMC